MAQIDQSTTHDGTMSLVWQTLSSNAGRLSPLIALSVLVVINIAITPNFLTMQTLTVNLSQVCTIVIVAVGMTLVVATGGIDLSVGSIMAISGALAPSLFMGVFTPNWHPAVNLALGILVPVFVATCFGAFNGVLIARFRIQPIVATLVLFIAGRGLAQVWTNGNLQVFSEPAFQSIALGRILGIPGMIWIMAAFVAASVIWLGRSKTGRYALAIGGNRNASLLSGVPVSRVLIGIYAASGFCAGVAGLLVVAVNSAADANTVGKLMELDAIAAVAVGGTLLAGGKATVLGTLNGALIIQLVRYTLLANGVPDSLAMLAKAVMIVLAVWLQRKFSR